VRLPERQSQYLDAWRGGAAIVVLIGHSFQIFEVNPWPIWGAGATGAVMVFFVLSGFLIRKSLDSCMAKDDPARFVTARVNRIVAPFLFSIALTVALWAIAPAMFQTGDRTFAVPTARTEFSLQYLPSTLLFVNGFFGGTLSANGPLWSLSCEVWYYALALLLTLKRWRWLGIVIAAVLTWRSIGFAILGSTWALGFFLPRMPKWLMLLPAAGLLALLAMPTSEPALYAWEVSVGVAFAAHLANLPEQPPRTWIYPSAAWSYTLYVVHFPLLLFAYGVIGVNWLVPFAVLGLAALIGPHIEKIKIVRRPSREPAHEYRG
jgi:peptidoglycan/LPS O-acetylase OafA/YrhL